MGINVGKVAKMFGISRTALLYYEQIGLIEPAKRAENGYRVYSENDVEKLRQVMIYRDAGIPLEEIGGLMQEQDGGNEAAAAMLRRLAALNEEIRTIQAQQEVIVGILRKYGKLHSVLRGNEKQAEAFLCAAGLAGNRADKLHADLEKHSPEFHARFLEAMGFTSEEIAYIVAEARRSNEEVNEEMSGGNQ